MMKVKKSYNSELNNSGQAMAQSSSEVVMGNTTPAEFVSSKASLAARAYAMPQIHYSKFNTNPL